MVYLSIFTEIFWFVFFRSRFSPGICRAWRRWSRLNTSSSCVRIKSSSVLSAVSEMLQVWTCTVTQSYEIWCSVWCVAPAGEIPAAADDCVHTVPFQFDLMKLLPKCQQIELFFYTFSRGTTPSSIHPTLVLSFLTFIFLYPNQWTLNTGPNCFPFDL